ncbi:MAG: 3-keto-disaccharide hydrolase [Prosthecobacter sp.]
MKFRHLPLFLSLAGCAALAADPKPAAPAAPEKPSPIGYSDTPIIPGTKWKVHDIDRPRPDPVAPGEKPGAPPSDAIVIFDGTSTDALQAKEKDAKNKETGKMVPCPWPVDSGVMMITGGDCWTKQEFASCQLHLEWMSEPHTKGNSQKKGNAGVFFMDRYESQMMDNDNNPTYADGMTGSIYGQTPPLVNAVRPAGQWQVYDIIFTAPKLEGGKVVEPAYITTFVNGVCVQNHTKIMGPTKHKNVTDYSGEFPEKAPIRIQDHKNEPPVRIRNIWIRPM